MMEPVFFLDLFLLSLSSLFVLSSSKIQLLVELQVEYQNLLSCQNLRLAVTLSRAGSAAQRFMQITKLCSSTDKIKMRCCHQLFGRRGDGGGTSAICRLDGKLGL